MNLKKVFVALILLVMTTILLSGCGSTTDTTVSGEKPEPTATAIPTKAPPTVSSFVVINSQKIFTNTTQYIMYDPETMVMWSALYTYTSTGDGISHSPMYNADGTIRLYNPTDK